jgi:integrase/recombinase XerD
MTQVQPITNGPDNGIIDTGRASPAPRTALDRILERLTTLELPGKNHLEDYLRHKWRLNHKPRTLSSSFTSLLFFLGFYGTTGKEDLEKIERVDIEAFIEHEQDRGMAISTVRLRLACLIAFLHYLMEQEVIPSSFLKRTIKLKLPETLPRAINPRDVKKLVSVIHDTRDRALILLLLRTGIRIGEALSLTVNDIDIRDRKVHLYQGEKNSMGRVVYVSDDALFALKRWLVQRDKKKERLFSTRRHHSMCYSTARNIFVSYSKKAGLDAKGYTLHCLRHTFASELLNAGMRLEVLQQLMGHQDIEVTRRYARLTDRTREEEYFRAMAIIERGGIGGDY